MDKTQARLLVIAVATLFALCGIIAAVQPASAATFVPIRGAGSTWSYNAINQWIQDVNQFGMTVNYLPVGSTPGRQFFAQGTVDWAASEIPYGVQDGNNFDPPPERGFAYMPDTAGGLAFMYNLSIGGQRVTDLRLSGAVIAGIFTNTITMWNDPAIVADNPGLTLPAIQIVPVVRTDGSGATREFTQWMLATEPSYWTAYCAVTGRIPCTATSAYPVQPGTNMIGQAGDLGVTGYVSQAQANGAIGYVEDSFALETGFPVAKVLNAAGYYTAPTPDNVGVSLLKAQVDNNPSDPRYGTADLSQVYTDTDPRTYELSYYSYMILPTDSSNNFSSDKGYTLGAFGQFLLCQGQQHVDQLGYAALPINLVEDGYAQLQKVPGASLPATTSAFIASCANPTISADGTDALAGTVPMPPACDQQGPTQCLTGTDTTPPVISVPSPITVDATSPSGAVVTYSVSATDPDDAVASLSCVPASGSTFPIGTTTVNCMAADTHGLTSRASFTIHVKGAPEQLADLLTAVIGVGPGTSLAGKVTLVDTDLAAGDVPDACSTLGAFRHEVAAQSGKKIPTDTAATLIAAAQQISTVLTC